MNVLNLWHKYSGKTERLHSFYFILGVVKWGDFFLLAESECRTLEKSSHVFSEEEVFLVVAKLSVRLLRET